MLAIPTIFGFIAGLISVVLSIFVAHSYVLTKIKATIILLLVVSFVAVNEFLFAVVMSLPAEYELLARWSFIFIVIFGILPILFLVIFLEYIEFGRVRTQIAFVFGILTGAIMALLFLPNQITPYYDPFFLTWMVNLDYYLRSFILILGLIIIFRLIRGVISILRAAINKRLKFQFKIAFSGIFMIIVGLFVSSASGILISHVDYVLGSIIRGSFPIFVSAGLIISFIGFSLNPYSIYLISQKAFRIIVFNSEGLTIYDHKFRTSSEKHSTMITGAIYGISSMVKDALGIESYPRSLEFLGRTLIFEFKGKINFALISDQDSQILRNSLRNFSEQFLQTYGSLLENWDGAIYPFKGAISFIKNSFPYLEIEENQTK